MQNHYNLIYREEEREMIPLCVTEGVGIIPRSPLARGLLAREGGPTLRSGTDEYGKRLYGGEDDSRVIEAVESLDLQLTPEERARPEEPYRPHPVLGHQQPKA
jgi:aryl-alcohol dehydrogenase-like predicted oxidoreductase